MHSLCVWMAENPDFGESQGPWWPKVPVAGVLAGTAHGVELGGARVYTEILEKYYISKWGGLSGEETYSRPFNNPDHDLSYWYR